MKQSFTYQTGLNQAGLSKSKFPQKLTEIQQRLCFDLIYMYMTNMWKNDEVVE